MFLLASRTVMAAVFTIILLAATGKLNELWAIFKNKKALIYLIVTSVLLIIDWGVFIWAVQIGHVFDVSIGYYINPIVMLIFGIIFFKEKCQWFHITALAFMVVAIIYLITKSDGLSYIAVILALDWAVYSVFMKKAGFGSLVAVAGQTLILAPFAILFLAFSDIGAAGFAGLNFGKTLLIIGSGVITAAPIILFNTCVTKLNLVIMSFAQYLSPTFGLICGFILKDELTTEKLISYCFIWTGLIIFLTAQTITAKREEKKALLEKEEIKSMPKWPAEGCVKVTDDVIVIKLGTEGEN